ncbi:MAG TPA: 3-oxoacyl-ACP synthase, partial [Verrucomicrobia bacterium]|nr:3-oxoacyl-ACP synthase [Verrucomicrobiota bacterium]
MGIRILGTGSYLPPRIVTNDDIAKSLDTSDEWIFSHTGIHSRHVADAGESTSTMAAKAAQKAMEAAHVQPEDVGLI